MKHRYVLARWRRTGEVLQATLTVVAPWIIRTHRTVAETVPATPTQVRAFYVDLHNIAAVHPLVVAVHSTGRRDTPGGYVETYRVQDRIPLVGRLGLPISYRVQMVVPAQGDVTTESRQFPWVRLRSVVSFAATEGGDSCEREHRHRSARTARRAHGASSHRGPRRDAGRDPAPLRDGLGTRRVRYRRGV